MTYDEMREAIPKYRDTDIWQKFSYENEDYYTFKDDVSLVMKMPKENDIIIPIYYCGGLIDVTTLKELNILAEENK